MQAVEIGTTLALGLAAVAAAALTVLGRPLRLRQKQLDWKIGNLETVRFPRNVSSAWKTDMNQSRTVRLRRQMTGGSHPPARPWGLAWTSCGCSCWFDWKMEPARGLNRQAAEMEEKRRLKGAPW